MTNEEHDQTSFFVGIIVVLAFLVLALIPAFWIFWGIPIIGVIAALIQTYGSRKEKKK